jgi:FKBP-type peptidyl-prolyl cis-trans isomerase
MERFLRLMQYNLITMKNMKNKFRLVIIAGIVLFLTVSCDMESKLEKEEEAKIKEYVSLNMSLDYTRKESGLYYCDSIIGTGDQVLKTDSVYFDYIMRFIDEYVIQDSSFAGKVGVGELLTGIEEALLYMNDGGWSKIIVPSYLGYGNTGYNFPTYTPLLFDLNITKVVHNK